MIPTPRSVEPGYNASRMTWASFQAAALVLALVTAGSGCVASCAMPEYENSNLALELGQNSDLPPCHRQSPAKDSSGCHHPTFVAETGSLVESRAAQTITLALLPVQAVDLIFLPLPIAVVTEAASPPLRPDLPLSTVLQI